MTVQVETPFVSLLFTSLDNQPLTESRQILITAMARDRKTGAEFSGDGTRRLKLGSPPLLMEPVQATIRLAGALPISVHPLDVYGGPVKGRKIPLQPDGTFAIDGTFQAYYYEIRR